MTWACDVGRSKDLVDDDQVVVVGREVCCNGCSCKLHNGLHEKRAVHALRPETRGLHLIGKSVAYPRKRP